MLIEIKEAINGFTLEVLDHENPRQLEVFETKRDVLNALSSYINKAQIHELNLMIEGVN